MLRSKHPGVPSQTQSASTRTLYFVLLYYC